MPRILQSPHQPLSFPYLFHLIPSMLLYQLPVPQHNLLFQVPMPSFWVLSLHTPDSRLSQSTPAHLSRQPSREPSLLTALDHLPQLPPPCLRLYRFLFNSLMRGVCTHTYTLGCFTLFIYRGLLLQNVRTRMYPSEIHL